jgi:hypothetical protein
MLNAPIRSVERQLWNVAGRIAKKLPPERVRELEQVVFRLIAYVVELEHQKKRVDQAWAELEVS